MACFGVDLVLADGSRRALGTHRDVDAAKAAGRAALADGAFEGARALAAEILDVSGPGTVVVEVVTRP